MGQLRSKRDEFWETQPAFDGRREIWDALRAACETDDQTLAQAIVDGASISLPTGKKYVFFVVFSFLKYQAIYPIRSINYITTAVPKYLGNNYNVTIFK